MFNYCKFLFVDCLFFIIVVRKYLSLLPINTNNINKCKCININVTMKI